MSERVKAVRQAIGDHIELMTDCNQQFNVNHTIRLGRELEQYRLAWIEEPICIQ
jgi:L-alanine-DL-glutamate epimerase-like enolase superfamily enzyme